MNFKQNLLLILLLMMSIVAQSQFQKPPKINIGPDAPTYDSVLAKINHANPLFVNGNVANKDLGANVLFSCIIIPFSPGIAGVGHVESGIERTNPHDIQRYGERSFYWLANKSITDILQYLYGKPWRKDSVSGLKYRPYKLPLSRVKFSDELDTAGLVTLLNGSLLMKNMYTIQFTTSKADVTEHDMRKFMIAAIELQFGLKTKIQRMKRKCIVISKNKNPIPEYKEGEIMMSFGTIKAMGQGIVKFNKVGVEQLVDNIENYFPTTGYPVIDETGFKKHLGMVDFLTKEPQLTYDNLKTVYDMFLIKL